MIIGDVDFLEQWAASPTRGEKSEQLGQLIDIPETVQ